MKTRIGPKMRRALEVLYWTGPLPSKLTLAEWIGPNGSRRYGYQIVDRCISAGLLYVDPQHPKASPHGKGAVCITGAGMTEAAYQGAEREGTLC